MSQVIKSVNANMIAEALSSTYRVTEDESIFLANLIDGICNIRTVLGGDITRMLSADEEYLKTLGVTIG